jgi:hypothetical protein
VGGARRDAAHANSNSNVPTFPSASVPQCSHGRNGHARYSWWSALAPLTAFRARSKQGLLDSVLLCLLLMRVG